LTTSVSVIKTFRFVLYIDIDIDIDIERDIAFAP
jgi:hypothetical protein